MNTEDGFNQQKPLTVDMNQIDNFHDWLNLIKVSEGEELKSLNYSYTVNVIKVPNPHRLDTAISHFYDLNVKGLNEVTTLILDYLYDLGQSNTILHDLDDLGRCNKLSYDLGELNLKQVSIKIKFGLLTRSINSGLLTRSTNGKDISA
jgi:hypothetical protein